MKNNIINCITICFLLLGGCSTNVSEGQSATANLLEGVNEVIISVTLSGMEGTETGALRFSFYDNADFEGDPVFTRSLSLTLAEAAGDVRRAYSFQNLDPGKYFLKIYLDENRNGSQDDDEKSGIFTHNGETQSLQLGDSTRKTAWVSLN